MKNLKSIRLVCLAIFLGTIMVSSCTKNEEHGTTEKNETPFTQDTKDIPKKDTGDINGL